MKQPIGNLLEAAENQPFALVVVEANSKIGFMAAQAEQWLDSRLFLNRTGLVCQIHGGTVLSEAIDLKKTVLKLPAIKQPSELATPEIVVRFFYGDHHSPTLLLMMNTSHREAPLSSFSSHFALSRAEAELTAGLVGGLSLNELAVSRQASINTVRSQLKAIFRKTATHRQTELMSLYIDWIYGVYGHKFSGWNEESVSRPLPPTRNSTNPTQLSHPESSKTAPLG